MQPRNTHDITFPHIRNAPPHLGNVADDLMPGNEGQLRLHRPVTIDGVDICVTHAAGGYFDQYFARPGYRDRNVSQYQRP